MKRYELMNHTFVELKSVGYALRESRRTTEMLYGDDAKPEIMEAVDFAIDCIVRQVYIEELTAAKTDEEKEAVVLEIPGDFVVCKPIGKPKDGKALFFGGYDKGEAIIREDGEDVLVFDYLSKAEEVAETLGEGWRAVDVCEDANKATHRLLDVIMEAQDEE